MRVRVVGFGQMKLKNVFRPAAAESAPPASLPPPTHEQIAALAHAIWVDRGRPVGHDLDNWLEAERQLRVPLRKLSDIWILDDSLDPEYSVAGRVERALDRVAGPPEPRSPTSL